MLRDGVTEPRSVAIIHCVGSRDKNTNEYCSAICCMSSLKFDHLVMEKTGAQVYNFYIDMRPIHKGYEEFYHRILDEGTQFIRGRVAEITDAAHSPEEEGKLIVIAEDTLIGRQRRVPVDMVILAAGLEPRADAQGVAHMFGVGCGDSGFFTERHPKLDPVATMTEGCIWPGVPGPKDIPTPAQGCERRVSWLIFRKQSRWTDPRLNRESRCSAPHLQHEVPYNSISFIEERRVARHPACARAAERVSPPAPARSSPGRTSPSSKSWPRSMASWLTCTPPRQSTRLWKRFKGKAL